MYCMCSFALVKTYLSYCISKENLGYYIFLKFLLADPSYKFNLKPGAILRLLHRTFYILHFADRGERYARTLQAVLF